MCTRKFSKVLKFSQNPRILFLHARPFVSETIRCCRECSFARLSWAPDHPPRTLPSASWHIPSVTSSITPLIRIVGDETHQMMLMIMHVGDLDRTVIDTSYQVLRSIYYGELQKRVEVDALVLINVGRKTGIKSLIRLRGARRTHFRWCVVLLSLELRFRPHVCIQMRMKMKVGTTYCRRASCCC